MPGERKVWTGDLADECQVCKQSFNGVMYDARLPSLGGGWANVCEECFDTYDAGLGEGRGQMYKWDAETEEWVKVETPTIAILDVPVVRPKQ